MKFLIANENNELLARVFQFRFDIFCLEKQFYSKDSCRFMSESDEYDSLSTHIVAISDDEIIGYVRLIHRHKVELPLEQNISYQTKDTLRRPSIKLSEISRLAINRNFRRSISEYYSLFIQIGLYKKIYQISEEFGLTHLGAIMEDPLFQNLTEYGIEFKAIGPKFYDHGIVAPYLCNIAEAKNKFINTVNLIELNFDNYIPKVASLVQY